MVVGGHSGGSGGGGGRSGGAGLVDEKADGGTGSPVVDSS